ncbi:hypothetical protein V8E54_002520 [Elaphomyces granulatus]
MLPLVSPAITVAANVSFANIDIDKIPRIFTHPPVYCASPGTSRARLISDGCQAVTDQVRRSASVVDPPSVCSRCLQPWDGIVSGRRTCDRCRNTHRHTDIWQSIIPLVGTSESDGVTPFSQDWSRSCSFCGIVLLSQEQAVVVYHGYRPVMIFSSQLSRISRRFNNVFAFSTIDTSGRKLALKFIPSYGQGRMRPISLCILKVLSDPQSRDKSRMKRSAS